MQEIQLAVAPYYLQIKFVHLLMVAVWSFSTMVAYRNYVYPAFIAWQKNPQNLEKIARRNNAMERFDRGVEIEHFAFPVAIVTGLLLVWISGWSLARLIWLTVKIGILAIVFLPVEIVDYYLSHFGGNKAKIRASGDAQRYEAMMLFHWRFLRFTTPLVLFFIPAIFYLAVAKPL